MNVFTSIIVYLIIFWTVLFMVLPWGNRARDIPEGGAAGGAPLNPRVKMKFLITAGVSFILWGIIFALVHFEIIDFYQIAQDMVIEDKIQREEK